VGDAVQVIAEMMVSSYERDRHGGDRDEYLSFLSLSSLMQWDDGKVVHGIVWKVLPDVVVPASGWGQMSVGVLPGRWDVVVLIPILEDRTPLQPGSGYFVEM